MFEEDDDASAKLPKEPTRTFASLEGLQMITALSAQSVLGIEGIDYRALDDGLYEMPLQYTIEFELGCVVNRFEPPIPVFFRPRPDQPTMLYGVDERLDKVVIEIGTRRVEPRFYGRYADVDDAKPDSKTAVTRMFFRYNRQGYTPKWFRDLQKAQEQGPYR